MKLLTEEERIKSISTPLFKVIGEVADDMGVACYVIGGWVRDLYLGRPSKDVDCAVVAPPELSLPRPGIAVAKAVAERWKEETGRKPHVAVFHNFGTAQLKVDETEVEFVGARRESYSHDSRKPIIEDGTLEDDQNRRDFTINAMAICLNAAKLGELADPFHGIYDLEDGLIATPLDPDITFSDDPLRMLRCIRFATQLNFQIEEETSEALSRNAERIKIISGERICEELNKIMLAPHPSKGLLTLMECGLLELILPEVAALAGVEQAPLLTGGKGGFVMRSHKDNFFHTLEVVENVVKAEEQAAHDTAPRHEAPWPWLRWAALLHDIGKPATKRWDARLGWTFHNHDFTGAKMVPALFRRLKLPLDERMKYVQKLVALHMRPQAIADEEVTDSAVRRLLFDAGDDIDDLMLLCDADITSKNEAKRRRFHENFRIVREKLVTIEEKDRIRNMKLPVSGEEIMARYNLPPSPPVGRLKEAMKEAILDGRIPNDHDAAIALLDEVWKEDDKKDSTSQ